MPDDKTLTLRQADSLYQSFPDFSAWPAPKEDDLQLWDRFASLLKETRKQATPEALRNAVEVAVRAAAIDTGAIEGLYTVDRGFTMTVATQALAWEHALGEKGEKVRELFEAQLEAYELVIDAVTHKLSISEAWIRALHEKVCAQQQTYRVLTDQGYQEQEFPKGSYKTQPNHVRLADGTLHSYAPVDRVSSEMYRLLEQIRTPEFESAHPVAQASYIHYVFVVIHPFADGNGRVARALASVFFYRAHSIPFLVFANQRTSYFDALHQADLGQARPLLAFFLDRGIDTLQLVIDHLLTAEAPSPKRIAARIRLIDDVALRLLGAAKEQIRAQFDSLDLPIYLELYLEPTDNLMTSDQDYRQVAGSTSLEVAIEDYEHEITSETYITVLIARDMTDPFPLCLIELDGSNDDLEARFEDVHPEISENLRLRLKNWCGRFLGRVLKKYEERRPVPRERDESEK
ncbi:MAG TPA: Fic family protein [Thermoanaerobaculia bacterium]|jgi:Fic family protein|nr:Fic family protein [Thermoanaerobaculia bacterium]